MSSQEDRDAGPVVKLLQTYSLVHGQCCETMDLRVILQILSIISLAAAAAVVQDPVPNEISDAQGDLSVHRIKSWLHSKALHSILNTTADKRNDNYFDSFSYCYKSVVGQGDNATETERVGNNEFTERQFIIKTLLIMKCVVVTDAVTIPYNVFQDAKQSLVQVRREFSWQQIVNRILMIPFVMIRSALAQPSRAFDNLLGVVIGSILSYFNVYA